MADVSVISVERDEDGDIVIRGAGFTRTTTTIFVNGEALREFMFVSEGELILEGIEDDGAEITVGKGEIVTDPFRISDAAGSSGQEEAATDPTAPEGHTPNTSTAAEGEDDLADATAGEMEQGAGVGPGAPEPASAEFKGEQDPSVHPDNTTFRSDVENTGAGDLGKYIAPHEPYPTGNPPSPEDEYAKIHGRRPDDTDALPKF